MWDFVFTWGTGTASTYCNSINIPWTIRSEKCRACGSISLKNGSSKSSFFVLAGRQPRKLTVPVTTSQMPGVLEGNPKNQEEKTARSAAEVADTDNQRVQRFPTVTQPAASDYFTELANPCFWISLWSTFFCGEAVQMRTRIDDPHVCKNETSNITSSLGSVFSLFPSERL